MISVRSRKGAGSVPGSRASSLTLFSLAPWCCLPALLIDSHQLGLGDRLSRFPLFPIIKNPCEEGSWLVFSSHRDKGSFAPEMVWILVIPQLRIKGEQIVQHQATQLY